MNSFITVSSQQKRMLHSYIKAEMDTYNEMQRNYLIYRIMGIMCTVFNERYGFGRKRLCELVYLLGENFKQLDTWHDDADDLLIHHLRRIHMDELANALQGEVDKLKSKMKGE